MNKFIFEFFASWVFILLVSATAMSATLSGKATVTGEGKAGIVVSAWPKGVLSFEGTAPYQVGPTSKDGIFSMGLPAGQYFILAESKELFAYYGRNTVSVPEEGLSNINLLMVPKDVPAVSVEPRIETGVLGVVLLDGKPVPGAVVFIYPDLNDELKGFGLGMAAPTADDGVFEVPLSAGTYYLVARVRLSGGFAGPLKAGDLFGYAPLNPVVLKEGEVARVSIPVIEVPEKVSRHADKLFGNTRISGRVVDAEGKPVKGIKAMLYADSMMLDRPLYVSQPTGPDGTFVLSFPEGGTYYLAARDKLGGTPAPGELYGRYDGRPDHSIYVLSGKEKKGIKIVVEEVW